MKQKGLNTETNNTIPPDSENNDEEELNEIIFESKKKMPEQNKTTKKAKNKKQRVSSGIVTTTQIPNYKKLIINEEDANFVEFVLADFHDFHNVRELKSFQKLTSLSLICEFISDIKPIVSNIPNKPLLKTLNLNENQLKNLEGIGELENLEELFVSYNNLKRIDKDILSLKKLRKLWLNNNEISVIENVPKESLTNLWLAGNYIQDLPESFAAYAKLENLNLSGNLILNLKNIYILEKLKSLKRLYLIDVNFGDNPITQFINYRQIVLHNIKNLEILDQIYVTEEELQTSENNHIKKKMFYLNKIRHNHKICKMIFQMMRTHKLLALTVKLHQNKFFIQRKKMLEFAKYERVHFQKFNTHKNKEIMLRENSKNDIEITTEKNDNDREVKLDEIEREINLSSSKSEQCEKITEKIIRIFKNLKQYLSYLNDLSIVSNFYDLETSGNLKIEPGNSAFKWVKSCIELMKYKISKPLIEKHNINQINFNHVFKITNKQRKIAFDAVYDQLVDDNGKFGDEQKFFDFFFLVNKDNISSYRELFSMIFDESNEELRQGEGILLTDNLSFINLELNQVSAEINENNVAVICKCANFASIIQEIPADDKYDLSSIRKIYDFFREKCTDNQNPSKLIFKYTVGESGPSYYYYKVKQCVAPEYIIEYTYGSKDGDDDLTSNHFWSSFNYRTDILSEHEMLFNMCSEKLFGKTNKQYFCNETLNKYSYSKFGEFSEIDNGFFFFAKSSLFSFLTNCFKYQCFDDFANELNKINEKIQEIANIKFPTHFENFLNELIENKSKEDYQETLDSLRTMNCFNQGMTSEALYSLVKKIAENSDNNELVRKLKDNITEIILSSNKLTSVDLDKIIPVFPNLHRIDLSNNNIKVISSSRQVIPELEKANEKEENSEENMNYTAQDNKDDPLKQLGLTSLDISFNKLNEFETVTKLFANFPNLRRIKYIGNPFDKLDENFIDKMNVENPFYLTKNDKDKIIKDYNDYVKAKQNEKVTLKIDVDAEPKRAHDINKNFDYFYDCFSYTENFRTFSENAFFREKIYKESNLKTVILTKKKLHSIPSIVNKSDTQVLYINLNKISKIANLAQFKELLELYIQNNKIQKLENIPKTLRKLDISNNELTELKGLSNAKNLEWLNVENNSIKSILEVINLPNMAELYSAGNFISNIKECCQLGNLKKLEVLDISGNEICRTCRDLRMSMIYYCRSLRNFNRINIDNDEKIKAKEYFTGKLTSEVLEKRLGVGYTTNNLTELDLSSLKLKDEAGLFSKELYPRLTKLNLSRNIFKSFSTFGYLPKLVELNLNYNLFCEIFPKQTKIINGKGVFGLPNLESLEMSGNQIVNLNGIQFFKKLRILVLRENNIAKLDSINHMEFLTFLDVSSNKIRNCDRSSLGILPSLQVFLCDNNYLKNINPFEKFQNVQTLSFENNKIADFSSLERLQYSENLKEISIVNNPIVKQLNYRTYMLKLFPNLVKIDNREITAEEREMLQLEMQMNDDNYMSQNNPNSLYFATNGPNFPGGFDDQYAMPFEYPGNKKAAYGNHNNNYMNKERQLKKVNYIQIGYMMPFSMNLVNPADNLSQMGLTNTRKGSGMNANAAAKPFPFFGQNLLPQIKVYSNGNNSNVSTKPTPNNIVNKDGTVNGNTLFNINTYSGDTKKRGNSYNANNRGRKVKSGNNVQPSIKHQVVKNDYYNLVNNEPLFNPQEMPNKINKNVSKEKLSPHNSTTNVKTKKIKKMF